MKAQRAFKRDIRAGLQRLCQHKRVRRLDLPTRRQQTKAAPQAQQFAMPQRAIDQAVAPLCRAIQQARQLRLRHYPPLPTGLDQLFC